MTRKGGCPHVRAVDGARFKDRPVLVAVGLLVLVLLVFGAGMAAGSYQSTTGRPDSLRDSRNPARADYPYNRRG